MRARVVEMDVEKGFGRAQLSSGETLVFDVSVSVFGVPEVGADLEVNVGPSRLGGLKITRAEILPTWEATTLPCLCLGGDEATGADLLYFNGRHAYRTAQPLEEGERVAAGTTGQLVVERKRGAVNFFEWRVTGLSVTALDASEVQQLLAGYRELLVAQWESWEDVDSEHTASALEQLRTDVFIGLDLGLDVEALLTITAFPLESPGPRSVHDMRAFAPRPEAPAETIRLTRPS